MPYYTGYDVQGIDTAQDGTTLLTVGPTAYSSWFTPSYAGVRGAYRKKYFFSAPSTRQTPLVVRDDDRQFGNGTFFNSEILLSTGRAVLQKYLSSRWAVNSGNGTAATNLGINNAIEAEFPYYRPTRFSAARTIRAQELEVNSHTVRTTDVNAPDFFANPQQYSTAYQQHDAVGEDFALFSLQVYLFIISTPWMKLPKFLYKLQLHNLYILPL
jgi:hypothetical protein